MRAGRRTAGTPGLRGVAGEQGRLPSRPILSSMAVVNAPSSPNTGGYENRVTAAVGAGREVIRHAGANAASAAHADEQRKSQESGTH